MNNSNYMFCPNCGHKIKKGDKFCPYCRYNLKQSAQKAQSATSQQSFTSQRPQPQYRSQQNNYQQSPNYNQQPNYNYQSQPNYGYTQASGMVQKQPITPPHRTFSDAFKLFWKNYFNFSGYSTRAEFWWWFLIEYIIDGLFLIITWGSISNDISNGDFSNIINDLGISVIWYLVILIPNISLRARRFRDAGVSSGWIVALLLIDYVPGIIPFVGWFICFIARVATIIIECSSSKRVIVNGQIFQPHYQSVPHPQPQPQNQYRPQQPQQPTHPRGAGNNFNNHQPKH